MIERDIGILRATSKHSFSDTIKRIEESILSRGLTIFARINFSEDATRAGLQMPQTRLIIFGNPKSGTPLMLVSPSLALDLPLKLLISEDNSGEVLISYNSSQYLKDRHNIPESLIRNISGIPSIVESIT